MGLSSVASKFVASVGKKLKLPESGISEKIAGKKPQSSASGSSSGSVQGTSTSAPFIGPTQPSPSFASLNAKADKERAKPKPISKPKEEDRSSEDDSNNNDSNNNDNGSYQMPSIESSVPSAQDAANQAAEEARRIQEDKMRRFGELITPLRNDIGTALQGRRSIPDLFQQEMDRQGIAGKQGTLGTLEAEQTKLGGQLETIPNENIERRRETGNLTAAAERRIRSVEERPIREQLLKTSNAREQERVGLERAFGLVDKYLGVLKEQEDRDLQPLQYRLQGAQEQFGVEGEGFKSQIDSLASQLTGFNLDRAGKLKEYELMVAEGSKLAAEQRAELKDLRKMEIEQALEMEKIVARKNGTSINTFNKKDDITDLNADIRVGGDVNEIISEYLQKGVAPETILSLYNRNSPNGPTTATPEELRTMIDKNDPYSPLSNQTGRKVE